MSELGAELKMPYNFISSQLVNEIRSYPSSSFSIQLDESTFVPNLAQLLVYIMCAYRDVLELRFCFANLSKLELLKETFL